MNTESYLLGFTKQMMYYRDLGNKTIERLSDDQILYQPKPDSNSIAIIMKHLAGNIFSRWTMMFDSDGEKSWRDRDSEFILEENMSVADLKEVYGKAWTLIQIELDKLTPEDLTRTIYIRNEGHNVPDAFNRQLAHISYHMGQIVYLGKMMLGDEWHSLSIPKGQSKQYNQSMMSTDKVDRHYTDKIWDKE